ncbi:MAG: hypothetical protein ABIN89_27120, partial [Chitinophagaceae bacterium]
EDNIKVDTSQTTNIVIVTSQDRLVGYCNNELLFNLRDPNLSAGKLGLYCWGNTSAFFEGLEAEELNSDSILWDPLFSDLSELEVFDEPGTLQGPSVWNANAGIITQTSPIYSKDGNWLKRRGKAYDIGVGADGSVWVIGTNPVFGGYGIYLTTVLTGMACLEALLELPLTQMEFRG